MRTFSKADFEPLVDQAFSVRLDGQRTIPLKLASITANEMHRDFESFTLNLDPLDGSAALPDGTYVLHNEQWGEAAIFISATPAAGPEPGRYYYEAVFNIFIGDDGKP